MKSFLRLALPLAALITVTAAHAENPKPGQWTRQTSISVDGKRWSPLPANQGCLTPADANQSIEQILQKMVDQATQSGCRAQDLQAGDGKASGRFECPRSGGVGTVDVQATYSADRYEMTMVGTNLADRNGSGLVIPKIHMKHEGRNVGACKAG